MKRAIALTVGGCAVALAAPGAANAAITNPTCGQTVTQNVKLATDLIDCPADGLVLGRSGLTIDLNGHTIAFAEGNYGHSAIANPNGYGRLTLRNGTIRYTSVVALGSEGHNRFVDLNVRAYGRNAFSSTGGYNTVQRVTAQADQTAFRFEAGHNRITNTSVTQAYGAFLISGEGDNVIADNATTAIGGQAMSVAGDRNRIVDNVVEGDFTFGVGGNDNVLARNKILKSISGLRVAGSRNRILDNIEYRSSDGDWKVSGGSDTVVAGNTIRTRTSVIGSPNLAWRNNVNTNRGVSFDAASSGARITGSVFNGNLDGDGLLVESTGSLIRNNTANGNAGLGINAAAGTIDGGGNRASGNGDPRQCVGVVCQP